LLTRDNRGGIVCKDFDYLHGEFAGTSALCDDGSRVEYKFRATPSWAEFFDIDIERHRTYKVLKSTVIEATNWREIDADTKTMTSIKAWLNRPIPDQYLEEWYNQNEGSEYTPGFIILRALSKRDRRALKLREGDYGGMISTVPVVHSAAKTEGLNRMLERRNLPFIVIDSDLRWDC
jgi:hypothetical protein